MRPDCQLSRILGARAGGRGQDRRGAVTLWTVLSLPVLLLVLFLVADSIHLWVARVELENAMEAAALAAVKHWGDAGGGSTLTPRAVGVNYAAANTINGQPVVITDNAGGHPNENGLCSGNLIFGAVEQNTGDACQRYSFDATETPSCGGANVLFDASGQGGGGGGLTPNNAWGIAFHRTDDTSPTLRITAIEINLRGGGDPDARFNTGVTLSSNTPANWMVRDGSGGSSQPDIFGFTDPGGQITWSFPDLWRLRFQFSADTNPAGGTDDGFAPCDRFRFGVGVINVGQGLTQNDGDGIGDIRTTFTVWFQDGASTYMSSGHFNDTTEVNCRQNAITDAYCVSSLIVHADPPGNQIPDLPCPPSNASGNNGQSYGLTSGGGGGATGFGVRAQATIAVTSLLCRFCGNVFGPYSVSACATAFYDCLEHRPTLIRVEADDYTCPWY